MPAAPSRTPIRGPAFKPPGASPATLRAVGGSCGPWPASASGIPSGSLFQPVDRFVDPEGKLLEVDPKPVKETCSVGLFTLDLAQHQDSGSQQIRQEMTDRNRVSWIVEPFGQPVDDAGPVHHLPLRQRPRTGAEPFQPRLDSEGSVEYRPDLRYRLRYGVFLLM